MQHLNDLKDKINIAIHRVRNTAGGMVAYEEKHRAKPLYIVYVSEQAAPYLIRDGKIPDVNGCKVWVRKQLEPFLLVER